MKTFDVRLSDGSVFTGVTESEMVDFLSADPNAKIETTGSDVAKKSPQDAKKERLSSARAEILSTPDKSGSVTDRFRRLVTMAKAPMQGALAAAESIPQAVESIDLKTEFPYVGIKPESDVKGRFLSRYQDIQQDPNFLEDIATDPISYVPGVGQAVKGAKYGGKALRYAADPVLQSVGEYATRPEMTASEAGLVGGFGVGFGKVADVVAPKMKEGAVKSLAERMKLNQQIQPEQYEPIFKEKLVNWSPLMDNYSIMKNVQGKINEIGNGRSAAVEDAIKRGKAATEAEKPVRVYDLGGDGAQEQALSAINTDMVPYSKTSRYSETPEMNRLDPAMEIEGKNTFMPSTEGYLNTQELRNNIESFLDANLKVGEGNSEDYDIIKRIIRKELADLERNTAESGKKYGSGTIPRLDYALTRKSQEWAKKAQLDKTSGYEKKKNVPATAFELLTVFGSELVNRDPVIKRYNEQFADFLPLEKAMEKKSPVWGRNYYMMDVAKPMTLLRKATDNNAALRARYDIGGSMTNRRAVPLITQAVQGGSEE